VSPRHPLAKVKEALTAAQMQAHRAVVVADTSRRNDGRAYGHNAGQARLAVPSMAAKIAAQCAGLGVGWLPEARVASLLARGELVAKKVAAPREPNTLYVGWKAGDGRALAWWLEQLDEPRLRQRLVDGLDRYA
jgi:DNA-binding transcriptional LysR family regulator